jgi:hypothetical protein
MSGLRRVVHPILIAAFRFRLLTSCRRLCRDLAVRRPLDTQLLGTRDRFRLCLGKCQK